MIAGIPGSPGEAAQHGRIAVRRRRPTDFRGPLGWLCGVVSVILVGFLALARGDPVDPHGMPGRCAACHTGPAPEGVGSTTAVRFGPTQTSYPLRAPSETASCGLCHEVGGEQTHPVDVSPSFAVPATFPLDGGGRLVCSSCHDPHRASGGSARGRNPLLRTDATGETLCRTCHGAIGRADLRAWHVVVTEPTHGGDASEEPSYDGEIDRLSKSCLNCHDGSIASDVAIAAIWERRGFDLGKSHPIGMDYRRRAGPGRLNGGSSNLRDVSLLDDRIRLIDGKVGCGSCHNMYSGLPDFLVMAGGNGRLCMSCHDM